MKAFQHSSNLPTVYLNVKFFVLLATIFLAGITAYNISHAFGTGESFWRYVSIFGSVTFILILVHELGHVAMGRLFSLRWKALHLGFAVGVKLGRADGKPTKCREQLFVSLAGPVTQIVFSGAIFFLMVSEPKDLTAAPFAAFISCGDALFNLIFPARFTDGAKAARALFSVVRGQGRAAFR